MNGKKKAAIAFIICTLFLCTVLFMTNTAIPMTVSLPTSQKMDYPQLKGALTDPTFQINGRYYNVTWFQIKNETVNVTIEGNATGPPESNLTISWNGSNSSVAMPFTTSNVTTYFNGVQIWINYTGSPPELRAELRKGVRVGSIWVPSNESDAILTSQAYSSGNFTQSGGWATLLNETTIKLNASQTYFILLRLNETTTSGNYYSWGCKPASNGVALQLYFDDIEDINDTNLWIESIVPYNCWMIMNFTKPQYTLELQLPINWTLNQLVVDIFNSSTDSIEYSVSGSLEGNVTGGLGSFTISNITYGDRVYLAVITFRDIRGILWTHTIEAEYNSDGFARTVGNMSEAQRFTLPYNVENLSIQTLIRNTGLTENLIAEIWNASLDPSIGAYYPSGNVSGVALEIPYGNVTSNYEWLKLNFTGNFSQGDYFLVIHTKNWAGNPSDAKFYDWASHTSYFGIPPTEGYEIWTTFDNNSNWNWRDVRDPYGHRYWHCMKIQYNCSPSVSDINLLVHNGVNYERVGDNGVWNGTVWIPIQASNDYNVTFYLSCDKDISYTIDYTLYYYNYTNYLSNDTIFYIYDSQMTNSSQSYWSKMLSSTQASYNESTGIVTLVFTAFNTTSGEWITPTVNATISALMSYTNITGALDTTFTNIYTHSGGTISLSQEAIYIYYNPTTNATTTNRIFLNDTTSPILGNWTDTYVNSTTKLIKILKNAYNTTIGRQEISSGDKVNTTVTFYSKVNIIPPTLPYINTTVTLNITNVWDNPDYLNVTIIRPDGTVENNNATHIGSSSNWTFNFTPNETGKYIISVLTQSSIKREIGNQAVEQYYYILNVYQLGAGLLDLDTGSNLTLGTPFNLKVWVRYLPYNSSETPKVNITSLTIYLNGEPHNVTGLYNNDTGTAELPITPNAPGNLNITLEAIDNESRSITKSFIIKVVPPTPPSPTPILGLLTMNAAIGQFTMDTLSRIATATLFLLIASLIFMRAFYPDTLIRIHKKLLLRKQ